MTDSYHIRSTSRQSAVVEDKILSAGKTTRLVLRPLIVDNSKNFEASVKIVLIHQRKTPKETWEDVPVVSLNTLKAGEEVRLNLDSAQTLELYHQLKNLYAVADKEGVSLGETSLVVGREEEIIRTDAGRAAMINLLLNKGYSETVWKTLVDLDPDLATQLSYARIHTERTNALGEFRDNLSQEKSEEWWQSFFEKNNWIFGYGLNYQILKTVQSQPHYGGTNVSGKGAEKGDFLQHTEGEMKFTVLVEIKRPNTPLLGSKQYRNATWQIGEDLSGGLTQLQANCRRWEREGSENEENRDALKKKGVFTIQPKGILVIGQTAQLTDIGKRNTFELFRRNILNPEILTFDELHERAKFIVEHSSVGNSEPSENEIPF